MSLQYIYFSDTAQFARNSDITMHKTRKKNERNDTKRENISSHILPNITIHSENNSTQNVQSYFIKLNNWYLSSKHQTPETLLLLLIYQEKIKQLVLKKNEEEKKWNTLSSIIEYMQLHNTCLSREKKKLVRCIFKCRADCVWTAKTWSIFLWSWFLITRKWCCEEEYFNNV